MPDFLSYWKPDTADDNLDRGGLLNHAASRQFDRVNVGDTVWIVTVRSGELFLLGRIIVGRVTDRATAIRELGETDLWDDADDHILAQIDTAQPIQEIQIMQVAERLRFQSPSGCDRLELSDGGVNAQQLQRMRLLTPESADLLRERGAHILNPEP